MKRMIVLATALFIGSASIFAQDKTSKKDTTVNSVVYVCPMHEDVTSNKPGKCPKCGMDLVEKKTPAKKKTKKDSSKMKMND